MKMIVERVVIVCPKIPTIDVVDETIAVVALQADTTGTRIAAIGLLTRLEEE